MKLLLDTHVFLWLITSDPRLPDSFSTAFREPDNSAFLSVASHWEIIIKYKLGRLPLPESPEIYVSRQRESHRIESLPITESSLAHLATLPQLHRDPFDLCLISQAISEGLTLVTVDQQIMRYDVPVLT